MRSHLVLRVVPSWKIWALNLLKVSARMDSESRGYGMSQYLVLSRLAIMGRGLYPKKNYTALRNET